MASTPLPEGLTETDYEAIEAAVTETVRGRWFLSEFGRRNRVGELRQVLDAIGRLEASVAANQTVLPSADPSVRLLVQRIKEVAGHLEILAVDMRSAGVDEAFIEAVALQARAVAGMMRTGSTLGSKPPPIEPPRGAPRMPRADLPPALAPERAVVEPLGLDVPPAADVQVPSAESSPPAIAEQPPQEQVSHPADPVVPQPAPPPESGAADDPRLTTLSALDRLTLDEKLALFT